MKQSNQNEAFRRQAGLPAGQAGIAPVIVLWGIIALVAALFVGAGLRYRQMKKEMAAAPTPVLTAISTPAASPTAVAAFSPSPASPTPSSMPKPSLTPIAINISSAIRNNCIGFLTAVPEETQNIKLIGAAWTRFHPGPFAWGTIERTRGAYDFSHTDEYVAGAQQNNAAILATIWPFAEWDQKSQPNCKVSVEDQFYPGSSGDIFGIPPYRCKPNDIESYKKFLAALVARYDGDGVNDMPGLKIPVKYWEVLNEPEMKSPDLTFFIGSENDYLETLKESYQTIKQACPDCKVLHAGAAGSQPEFLAFWDKLFAAGAGNYFDVANIHHIGMGDLATLNVKPFKALLDKYDIKKPVWVTEAQFQNSSADVKASVKGALEAGAEKIFFVSFKVGGHSPAKPGEFAPAYKETVSLCPLGS